jgi:hypothetical protein
VGDPEDLERKNGLGSLRREREGTIQGIQDIKE